MQYVEITCVPVMGAAKTVSAVPSAAGSYTWHGLAGGVTYTFTLTAVDHSGNKSAPLSASGAPLDTTPPAAVTNLKAVAIDGGVVLFWTDPAGADLEYIQIECTDENGNTIGGAGKGAYPGIQTYAWTTGEYWDETLTNGKSYTFTVKAKDQNGNRSEAVSVTAAPPGNPNAAGGTGVIKLIDTTIYEIHTFTQIGTDTLSFTGGVPAGLTAWVLVVGGGGSGSAGHTPGNGGGAGGVAEHTSYPFTAAAYSVKVGAGGAAVTSSNVWAYAGKNGGDSSFGSSGGGEAAFIGYGGGYGGGSYYGAGHGGDGGSSGGSGDTVAATATRGVVPNGGSTYGNAGAVGNRTSSPNNNPQCGGGAGGPGQGANGGPGIVRDITGTPVTYAAGGGSNVPASNGEPGTGNGGRQAGFGPPATSYTGGSGIVIVRWPYIY